MPLSETVFIVNPHADGGSLSARWPRIHRSARRILGNHPVALTRHPGDAAVLAAAAAARPDDGIFHVTVIGDLPLSRVFLNLRHLYNGRIQEVKDVSVFTCTRVDAASDFPVLLDVDGEGPGILPSTLSLIPNALHGILPAAPDAASMKRKVFQ